MIIFGSWWSTSETGQCDAGCLLHLARRPAGGCTGGICEGLPREARYMEFWLGAAQARKREVIGGCTAEHIKETGGKIMKNLDLMV